MRRRKTIKPRKTMKTRNTMKKMKRRKTLKSAKKSFLYKMDPDELREKVKNINTRMMSPAPRYGVSVH